MEIYIIIIERKDKHMKNKSDSENFKSIKRFYLNMNHNDFLMEFIETSAKVKIWKSLLYIAPFIILFGIVVISKNLLYILDIMNCSQQVYYIYGMIVLGIAIMTFIFIRWIIGEYFNLTWKKAFMIEIKNLRKTRGE